MIQLGACNTLRHAAMEAVAECVNWVETTCPSEAEAAQYLVARLTANGASDYWYPAGESAGGEEQKGTIVLFDTRAEPRRTLFDNGRFARARNDVRWEGLGYFYASPFDLIQLDNERWCTAFGDFAASVYSGRDHAIRAVLKRRWDLQVGLIDYLNSGDAKTTLALFERYSELAQRSGLANTALSVTGERTLNIGHSIPLVVTRDPDTRIAAKKRASASRLFLDGSVAMPLAEQLWTLESRDRPADYPHGAVSFHDIVEPAKSDNRWTTAGFGSFFEHVGMQWLGAPSARGT
jgi:hypothetical protein